MLLQCSAVSVTTPQVRLKRDLLQVTGLADEEPEVLRVLGLLAMEQNAWGEALEYFQQVVALQPDSAADLGIAGRLCLHQRDYAQAAPDCGSSR